MNAELEKLTAEIKVAHTKINAAIEQIGKVVVGQKAMVNSLFVALLADGHILLEGLPGLAKTLAVTTLAKVLKCDFKRIQFTPDLLPADLLGTSVYNPKEGTFSINKGPIFTQILLADEINRAPAKVQSALLEVMQEKQVTIAGTTFATGIPYLVLATQNPIEHEGTYPLPEAQTDRFMMKIKIDYPSINEEKEILSRMGNLDSRPKVDAVLSPQDILETRHLVNKIYLDDKIVDYILAIIFSTRYPEKYQLNIKQLLLYGASPRATVALKLAAKAQAFLAGRAFVNPDDIKKVAHNILRHRLRRTYEAEAEGISSDDIVDTILSQLPVP